MRATDTQHGGPVPREDIAQAWYEIAERRFKQGDNAGGYRAMRAFGIFNTKLPDVMRRAEGWPWR